MDIFRNRLPSLQAAFYAFAACAFPIHVWSIINVLREVPAWILRLDIWDLLGVVAYTQAFALIESLIVFLGFLLLSLVLPAKLIRDRFVTAVSVIILPAAAWFVFLHYNGQIIDNRQVAQLVVWGASYLLLVAVLFLLAYRSSKFVDAVGWFVQRLAVLTVLYVLVDLLSVAVVIARNI